MENALVVECDNNLKNYLQNLVCDNILSDLQFSYCSDALKISYINNQLFLTDSKFDLCSDEIKLYYLKNVILPRKQKLAPNMIKFALSIENGDIYLKTSILEHPDYIDENIFGLFSDELKELYVITSNNITYDIFNILNSNLKMLYVNLNKTITADVFELCDDFVKTHIIDKVSIEKNGNVELFKLCEQPLKDRYCLNRIVKGLELTNEQFNTISDIYLKLEYINNIIKNNNSLTSHQFNSIDEYLKISYIESNVKAGRMIYDAIFELCSDEIKMTYAELIINSKSYIIKLTDAQFSYFNFNIKRLYINNIADSDIKLSDEQFHLCNDVLKEVYILSEMKYNQLITDNQFEYYMENIYGK